jgi:hypothetical protein
VLWLDMRVFADLVRVMIAQITIKEADNKHAQIVLSNCDLAYAYFSPCLVVSSDR